MPAFRVKHSTTNNVADTTGTPAGGTGKIGPNAWNADLAVTGELAVASGGTGGTDAASARTNLGAAATSHTHSGADITSGAVAVANGGTGATTAATARTNLGIATSTTNDLTKAVYFTSAAFGGVGDGATNNAPAWNAFHTYAAAESAAGRGVNLIIPPGIYNFDHSQCNGFLYNIKKLHIIGYGAVIKNIYNPLVSGENFANEMPWGAASNPNLIGTGSLINNTNIGDKTITLKTISQHSRFSVGDWVMVSSLDIQYSGYPPNCDQFEFLKVTAKNTTTGVLTLRDALRYVHRDDFPDGPSTFLFWGKARVWSLTGASGETWDIDHTYEGLDIRQTLNSNITYTSVNGRRVRFENCNLPGISQSGAGLVEVIGGEIAFGSEPDKLVQTCVYDGVEINGQFFQSSSIDRALFRNCRINGALQVGTVKSLVCINCEIEEVGFGQVYGAARTSSFIESTIRTIPFLRHLRQVAQDAVIDGSAITYSNGVMSVLKTSLNLGYWNVIPGMWLNLNGPGQCFSGPLGTGLVMRVYEDATRIYIETTLRHTSLPSWATGSVRFRRVGTSWFRNCTGSDDVRMASATCARGKEIDELFRYVIAGKTASSGYWLNQVGDLKTLRVNVMQPSLTSSARFNLTNFGIVTKDAMADSQTFIVDIDASVAGVREFTQLALTGKKTNDSVALGGVAQTALPANRWFLGTAMNWAYTGITVSGLSPYQMPVIEVEFEYDVGPYGTVVTRNFDSSGAATVAITGTLL